MNGHRPEAVANEFLEHAGVHGLTQLQIQKLVYIAHGWTLAIDDKPLMNEQPQAWDRGPVYPNLRARLVYTGSKPTSRKIHENDHDPITLFDEKVRGKEVKAYFSDKESNIIKYVWERYQDYDGFKLSNLTHQKETAWHKTYYEVGRNHVISDDLTKKHYDKLAKLALEKVKNSDVETV